MTATLDQRAHELAYGYCRSEIEVYCHPVSFGVGITPTFDLRTAAEPMVESVAEAVDYLSQRGLILRDANAPHIVSILNADAATHDELDLGPWPFDRKRTDSEVPA